MLNRWTIPLGILCSFFVVASAFGQEQSDPNPSNTTLSQAESVTIIQAIHAAELRTRNHIDKKSADLSKEISDIKTKELSELKTGLAVLKTEVNNLRWWLIALTTLVLIPLVFPSLKAAWQKWVKGGSTDGGNSSAFTQIQNFANRGEFPGHSILRTEIRREDRDGKHQQSKCESDICPDML